VLLATILGLLGGGVAGRGAYAAAASEAVPTGQLPATIIPTHYKLDLAIRPLRDEFFGTVEIDIQLAEPRSVIFLHGKDLNVTRAEVREPDGRTTLATYTQVSLTGVARVDFGRTLPAGRATLLFAFNAPFNQGLDGLYKAVDSGNAYAFSQFEAISARYLFPGFDQPGFKTPFDISVVAEASDAVVSNTPAVKTERLAGKLKRVTFATTEPLPAYLLAFAVGPLDIVQGPDIPPTALRPRKIALRGIAVKGKGPQLAIALQGTPGIVTTLEDYFGIAYPFAKLDLIAAADFAASGMENAGAIAYRETILLLRPGAPQTQKRDFELVHAHELSHQWFGDLVTPRWWDDIWLNEAFATWMGNKSTAIWRPAGEYGRQTLYRTTDAMMIDELADARRIHEPVHDEDGIANAFDDITYRKGAGVLAMFESFLGEEAFRSGVRTHLSRFRFGVATAQDFLDSLAQGSGHPEIVPAFRTFLDQPGVPLVEAKLACKPGEAVLQLAQRPYIALGGTARNDRTWQIPVCVRAHGGEKICALLAKPRAELALGAKCPAAVMPNADGAGYYRFTSDAAGWRALLAHGDEFNAAERLALTKNIAAAFRAGLLQTSEALPALAHLAGSRQWDLVKAALHELELIRSKFLGGVAKAKFDLAMTKLLAPTLAELGPLTVPGEEVNATLARPLIAEFLVRVLRDPATIAGLAPAGTAALANPSRADANMLETQLRAALETSGGAFAKKLIAAITRSRDSQFRRTGLLALSSNPDADSLGADVFPIVLSREFKTNEATLLLEELIRNPEKRAQAWPWLKTNFDAYSARFGAGGGGRTLSWLEDYCSAELRADIDGYFRPRIAEIRGGPRRLALTLEQVDQCLALKSAHGGEVNAYYSALGG
jgi:alanyl aminopeptidase